MRFQIGFAKIIPKPKRELIKLSPQQKFSRLAKKLDKSKIKLKKFHFNAIEAGKTIIVFDGEGNEVFQGENSVKGCQIARQHCLALYFSSKNQSGGFTFTTNVNYEFQTLEEMRKAQDQVKKQLEYNPFTVCNDCKFQFENQDEMKLHICTDQWIVFEFPKPRKRVYAYA